MNLDDNPVDAYHRGLKQGAERERRRIRRAQAKALEMLIARSPVWTTIRDAISAIDAATRAPKRKEKR